jgi:hypothetical protein
MNAASALLAPLMILVVIVSLVMPALIVARCSRSMPPESRPLWVLVAMVGSWVGLLAFFIANPRTSTVQTN